MRNHHFLLVCFPAQGHINPSLQLAKRLLSLGADVTFATSVLASRRMNKRQLTATPEGLSFATYSDGFDEEGFKSKGDVAHYFSESKRCGSQSLTDLIVSSTNEGRPYTFVIYSLLLTWAADVATAFDIPSALFFVQPATLLTFYYYFFNGYGETICSKLNDPSLYIELPGLPLFTSRDVPSFLSPSSPHAFILLPMREQIEYLESRPKVLVNTFDTLEAEALRAIDKLEMIPIGPLIPSAFVGGKDSSDTSFGGDLFQGSKEDYIEWLNSKPNSSVIYVSFGTICVLSNQQEDEIVHALLDSGHAFLWVITSKENNGGGREGEDEKLKFIQKLEGQGKIVPWCCQVEVLTHPSLGCFMTHCGWNSTIESLASGVPVVAFPQQIDQATNAKLIEDVWKTGVRVKANTEGIVEREEIRRCLDLVMGGGKGQGEEIKRNTKHWKELARQAVGEGGSSDLNLKTFVTEIGKGRC